MCLSYKKRNPKGTSAKTTDQCSICVTTVCSAFNKWEYNNSPTSNKWRRWVLMIKTDQQIQWSGEQSVLNIQKQDIWDRWGSGGIHMADKSRFLIATNYFWSKRQITHVQVNDTFLSFKQSEALRNFPIWLLLSRLQSKHSPKPAFWRESIYGVGSG